MDIWFPNGVAHDLPSGILIGVAISFAIVQAGLVSGMSTFFRASWSYLSPLSGCTAARGICVPMAGTGLFAGSYVEDSPASRATATVDKSLQARRA